MPSINELSQQVEDLQITLDAEQEQIQSAILGLNELVAQLKAQNVDGGTPEERQALADKLTAIKEDLEGTISESTTTTETV